MKDTHIDSSSTVDDFLKIDDDLKDSAPILDQNQDETPSELEPEIQPVLTKHTIVTSPWSRLLIIAVPFGLTFLAIFWLLNGIFNPSSPSVKTAEQPKNESSTLEQVDQKDGEVYAKLALNQQQDELSKINKDKSEKPQTTVVKTEKVVEKSPPTPPPTQQPRPATTRNNYPPEPRRSYAATPTKVSARTAKPVDPTTEFNRLRSLGSYGKIAYADTSDTNINETAPDLSQSLDPSLTQTEQVEQSNNVEPTITEIPQESTPNSIEKIRPRWQPQTKANKSATLANNYLPGENQILQEKQTRYLTVGEFANGVLITPVVKQEVDTKNESQQTDDGRRFVAKLTEDLRDNYGDVAIPSGSLLAVEVVSVDGGSYANVQVTSIIKDKTEYPISKGAIAVQGSGGKPLIAKKFQDKGGEITQYDMTVGLVSALGKVGEVINQPDSEEEVEDEFTGRIRRRSSGNRRDLSGALLEGAFSRLSQIVGDRAQTSTEEILARPNVWYIPQETKVTFLVNRTLELP
ncbi:TrbI/VirB10 family protein [Halotia branconii]|uniref:TrbI/VirB10 family protein n=1 Tax=Halotia branconii CENA392 TaxID=1539056 RepID=A0AAJ6NZ47_9CYAN|nr:TrbI/VirB10 family protein [Halotia branconii]WGV29073.1 TrbI/VirB10 family protein [Halotia branconii CENA392]